MTQRTSTPTPSPRRLIEGSDETALSLRAYEQAARGKLPLPFEQFLGARSKRQSAQRVRWVLVAALGACAGLLAVSGLPDAVLKPGAFFRGTREFGISAETVAERARAEKARAEKAGPNRSKVEKELSSLEQPAAGSHIRSTRESESIAPKSASQGQNATGAPPKTSKALSEGSTKALLQNCQALAARSQYSAAASCYGQVATTSSSTTAELAWLEKARLESRALGRADLAIQTLAAYRKQFPAGALAHEAQVAEERNQASLKRLIEASRPASGLPAPNSGAAGSKAPKEAP
jgi:hypothetical protein